MCKTNRYCNAIANYEIPMLHIRFVFIVSMLANKAMMFANCLLFRFKSFSRPEQCKTEIYTMIYLHWNYPKLYTFWANFWAQTKCCSLFHPHSRSISIYYSTTSLTLWNAISTFVHPEFVAFCVSLSPSHPSTSEFYG